MTTTRPLRPISSDIARRGAGVWDQETIQRLRQTGDAIQRDFQVQAEKMRTVSGDDLKVRSR